MYLILCLLHKTFFIVILLFSVNTAKTIKNAADEGSEGIL